MSENNNKQRLNFEKVNRETVDGFLEFLKGKNLSKFDTEFETDKCQYIKISFFVSNEKVKIIYDTKANILNFVAKNENLKFVQALFDEFRNPPVIEPTTEYKSSFSVKSFDAERFNALLKRIKGMDGVTVNVQITSIGKPAVELKIVNIVGGNGDKVIMRYMPQKKSLALQGKRSNLFAEIQVNANTGSDYKNAVSSHIDYTGEQESANNLLKELKKRMPDAFAYLSEQSKIDISMGILDIEKVVVSDYSCLLVPPFRGLERLIIDLLRLKGIKVELIGQAYDKTDAKTSESKSESKHILKDSYQKKHGIVYTEAMSALYAEYFATRNHYVHPDPSDSSVSRVIREREKAQEIFDRILYIINYNCCKLKEIGLKPEKNT